MKPLVLATAATLTAVILTPALLAVGGSNASGLSPQLADTPKELVPLAFQVHMPARSTSAVTELEATRRPCIGWSAAAGSQPETTGSGRAIPRTHAIG